MINSERLTFRKLSENDYDFFYELYGNSDVMKYAFHDRIQSKDEAEISFKETLTRQQQGESYEFIAVLKESNAEIGIVDYDVKLKKWDSSIVEIGYFIKPEYWGNGYATEMGKALIQDLFQNDKVHKITASCNSGNLNSERIMKKLGMSLEGIFKQERFKNKRWEDEKRYALLRDEWLTL